MTDTDIINLEDYVKCPHCKKPSGWTLHTFNDCMENSKTPQCGVCEQLMTEQPKPEPKPEPKVVHHHHHHTHQHRSRSTSIWDFFDPGF